MAQGQLGDLVIGTVPARAFKQHHHDFLLTLGLNKKYHAIAPLFANHPHFDDIHFYDGYDQWPRHPRDKDYLLRAKYDMVFDAMPKRWNEATWWQTEHQCASACSVYDLPVPSDGLHCQLIQWFDVEVRRDTVAFAPFAGWYNPTNDKRLSVEKAQQVIDLLIMRGYNVLQIGGPGEPRLSRATFCETSYFESIRAILGCALFVHTDTGAGWAISAYGFPQLGLYSHAYYGPEHVKNIQPINPQGVYLSEAQANDISLDRIAQAMDTMGL